MVSIVVAVYNIENYIQDCIKSLISQTEPDIEILLVDDGSTDTSPLLCDEMARTDSRIRVIHKPNGGLSSARNAGIEQATGNLLMFVDGDDYLAENAVELLLATQQKTDCDIVQFDYEETEKPYHKKADTQTSTPFTTEDLRTKFDKLYELGGSGASACTKLYRREVFETLRFQEGILHEDEQLIPFVLQKSNRITYISNKLYCYYTRPGSIIQSTFQEKKLIIFDILTKRIQILNHLGYLDLVEREKIRYFSSLVYFWADAKQAKNSTACLKLKQKTKSFLKNNNPRVSGYLALIKYLCKLHPGCIAIYYYLKKMRGN